jgi:outer membrane lipoprotein-sorting protein
MSRSILFFLIVSLAAPLAAERPSPRELLKRLDDLYRGTTSRGEMEMTLVTPDWKRTLDLKLWSRGMDRTFVVILSPKKDAGVATLRVDQEMWNFFPRINKVLKVPPSMMMGSWMGSDFTNDDMVKESSMEEDYDVKYLEGRDLPEGTLGLELTPKASTPTVWGRIVAVVHEKGLYPLSQEYYDEKGEKVRVMEFSDVRRLGKRVIPFHMELIPLKKEGHRTILQYRNLEFDVEVPESTFTLQNLRRPR